MNVWLKRGLPAMWFLAILLVFCFPPRADELPIVDGNSEEGIVEFIRQIETEQNDRVRAELAAEMWYILDRLSERSVAEVSDETIEAITALLKDRSDAVRARAAMALSRLGSRAIRSLPALRQALEESRVTRSPYLGRTGIHLDQVLVDAIEQIELPEPDAPLTQERQ